MNVFKKELIIGSLGVIFSISLVIFYGQIYQNKAKQTNQPQTTISITLAELQKHNLKQDCWVVIKNKVYDVTKYVNLHPGGASKINAYCGKDMTQAFLSQPHSKLAETLHLIMLQGELK